jgi:two-component system CheB/CheR fusion protein
VIDIFHLSDNDIGRPISDFVSLLGYDNLDLDVKNVLRDLTVFEQQVTLKDDAMVFTLRIRPYHTIDNVIDGVVLTFVNITDRYAADAALREAAALRLVFDSVALAAYCVDRECVTTACNTPFLELLGFKQEKDVIGLQLHDLIHRSHLDGSPYPQSESPLHQTLQTGNPSHGSDKVFFRVDGTSIAVEYWVRAIKLGGEISGAVCSFVDITERQRSEEQQGLLLKELDHRIKNLFAVVGGVVTLSARSAASTQEMAGTIQGRLAALASAHQLIRVRGSDSSGNKRGSTLEELLRTILAPYIDPMKPEDSARVVIEGPKAPITGEAVTSLALALHELATNAGKYGAFSTPLGRVHISWTVENGRLTLTWKEQGGPAIKGAPEREGFGSLLARRSIKGQLGGQLDFKWDPEGMVARFSVPVERLTQ